jgi:hypothetical protein
MNHLTQFLIRDEREQKASPHDGSQRMKCLVETIFPRVYEKVVGKEAKREYPHLYMKIRNREDPC